MARKLWHLELKSDAGGAPLSVPEEFTSVPPFGNARQTSGSTFKLRVAVGTEDGPEELELELPEDRVAIVEMLRAEMEALYINYGTSGLSALGHALDMLSDVAGAEDTSHRVAALPVYDAHRKEIEKRAAKACAGVQESAQALAFGRLRDSKREIVAEVQRYFPVSGEAAAERLLKTRDRSELVQKLDLAGPDASELISALDCVRKLRGDVAKAARPQTTPAAVPLAHLRANRSSILPNFRRLDQDEEEANAAPQRVRAANQACLVETAMYCLKFPILHRLLDEKVAVFELPTTGWQITHREQAFGPYGNGTTAFLRLRDGEFPLFSFAWRLLEVLQQAYDAAVKVQSEILADGASVWAYRPLIATATKHYHGDLAVFVERAVVEQLSKGSWIDWMDDAAAITGATAIVAGEVPPVAAALGLISFILSLPSLGAQVWQGWRDSDAAKASLDPSRSLAGEPSWTFFLCSVGITMLISKLVPARVLEALALAQGAGALGDMTRPTAEATKEP